MISFEASPRPVASQLAEGQSLFATGRKPRQQINEGLLLVIPLFPSFSEVLTLTFFYFQGVIVNKKNYSIKCIFLLILLPFSPIVQFCPLISPIHHSLICTVENRASWHREILTLSDHIHPLKHQIKSKIALLNRCLLHKKVTNVVLFAISHLSQFYERHKISVEEKKMSVSYLRSKHILRYSQTSVYEFNSFRNIARTPKHS